MFGIGGLGHLAVQIAKHFGAELTAVDVAEDKLDLAKSLGADHVLNAASTDVVKHFRKVGGLHAAIVTSAAKVAYDSAFLAVRPAGTLVVVGLPSEPLSFPAIMMREIRITSAATGTRRDMREVLELAADGKLHCKTETRPLNEINEIFEEMRQGKISGRIVVVP